MSYMGKSQYSNKHEFQKLAFSDTELWPRTSLLISKLHNLILCIHMYYIHLLELPRSVSVSLGNTEISPQVLTCTYIM